jgi:hypothetical protein
MRLPDQLARQSSTPSLARGNAEQSPMQIVAYEKDFLDRIVMSLHVNSVSVTCGSIMATPSGRWITGVSDALAANVFRPG